MSAVLKALEGEVTRFQAWTDARYPPGQPRGAMWEIDYSDWETLYEAFAAFVGSTSCREWDGPTTQLLLYAIARDNEFEELVAMVGQSPANLVCLAQRALRSIETDAKWQLAAALSTLKPSPPQVETLLVQFAHDEEEYVRRRALLALSCINSPRVADLVGPAWDTGDEYQRIAVLCALDQVDSPLLAEYAVRAEADGRQSLARYAAAIRDHGTLRGFLVQGLPVVDCS
jgi:hypothetical protein